MSTGEAVFGVGSAVGAGSAACILAIVAQPPATHHWRMMMARCLYLPLLALVLLAIAPPPARADTWFLPRTETYMSRHKQVRVTVTPRALEDQLRYFEDAVANVPAPGQRKGGATAATARLERWNGKGWVSVWKRSLLNDVAPVHVMVSDGGGHVVTFDDWHGMGYGRHAIVIYGRGGQLVRSLALTDIVPRDYFEALPRSVSSIRWRGDPRFSADGQAVIIPIVVPGKESAKVDVSIRLAGGQIAPLNAVAWQQALTAGKRAKAAKAAWEAARKAAFLAPLRGPKVNTQEAWHEYLSEAVARVMPLQQVDDGTGEEPLVASFGTSTTVLRLPSAKDYAISERWIAEKFAEDWSDDMALATLSEPQLLVALRKLTARMPEGRLKKKTIFVAISAPLWPEVRAIMQRTGAKLVHLDPGKPIPQRPERIADRYPQ
jgi:hypothetical protein